MLRRTFWKDLITGIAEAGQGLLGRRAGGQEAEGEDVRALCRSLLRTEGEASVVTLARRALDAFARLDEAGRRAFFEFLRDDLGPEPSALETAMERYRSSPTPETAAALTAAAEPPRQELLRLLNTAPDGTGGLLAMREALLAELSRRRGRGPAAAEEAEGQGPGAPASPGLEVVDGDFVHLLRSWFNRGFLELHRIDWRTPALVLEKIIEYEAVHQIMDWEDLRRRLQADRRCFGFFHPSLPDEPLIFVEVALCDGLAGSVTDLLFGPVEPEAASAEPDTAIFYSISNCQRGLAGISFGNFLIKQVVRELAAEVPSLRTFATLSPVPGFRKWLVRAAAAGTLPEGGAADADVDADAGTGADPDADASADAGTGAGGAGAGRLEGIDGPDWPAKEAPSERLRPRLMQLCAHYLLREKRGLYPLDPVARFHLRNGARLERISWRGDPSASGLAQSAGMMVNYVYDEAHVVANHEAFVNEGRVVCSPAVEALAEGEGGAGPATGG